MVLQPNPSATAAYRFHRGVKPTGKTRNISIRLRASPVLRRRSLAQIKVRLSGPTSLPEPRCVLRAYPWSPMERRRKTRARNQSWRDKARNHRSCKKARLRVGAKRKRCPKTTQRRGEAGGAGCSSCVALQPVESPESLRFVARRQGTRRGGGRGSGHGRGAADFPRALACARACPGPWRDDAYAPVDVLSLLSPR